MKLFLKAFTACVFLILTTHANATSKSVSSNCKVSIKAFASSGQPMSYRVQELEIEDNKIKTVFSWQGVVREKYVGELSEDSIKYLCKNLGGSAFFDLPSDFEDDEIEITGHRAVISLQITINGKYHSVYAADPSPKKELAALDTIWLIAFSKPWNDHMRVKAYTSKSLFRQQSE